MNQKQTLTTVRVIVLIATLTQICTDIYTPSLPAIAHDLHTTLGQLQMTMALFMAGVAITNLIYGPLSEGIGRRYTLMIGISIALVGTLICLNSHSILALQFGRFIQGCGLGACNSLWRSIFRDTYSGAELVRVSAYLVNLLILSVILAPFIGGYFQQYLGWHATFVFLFCWMILVLLIVTKLFKETSQHHGAHRLNINFVKKSYRELLTNRRFMSFCGMIFFTYGGLFAWLTSGSVVMIHGIGITPVMFGYLMIFSGLATAVGGFVNAKLTNLISLNLIVILGLGMMVLSGVLIMLSMFIMGLNIYVVLVPTLLFVIGSTFIFMNCFAMAFEDVGHIAGYAGSLYASIQLLGGTVFASLLGHLSTNSPIPMASMFIASGVLAGGIYAYSHKYVSN